MSVTATPRRKSSRRAANLFDEIIVDSFAGGGGASMGIESALGRSVDVAVNHDRLAIEMHEANHPATRHYCEDVWSVDPREATAGRPVGLMWASPDCKHFSRAKGAKPVEKKIRALAWVVVKWAKAVRPRVIILENVREFEDWGPLLHVKGPNGRPLYTPVREPVLMPDKTRKGQTFRRWVGQLRGLGYTVEWRSLNAADFGAPTNRRRLFLIARRDGEPIVWPEPTHGPGRKPYRTAAQCIDWSIPCPSIFDRKRPLAEKTMRRIAMGLKRYVLDNPKPFIVPVTHRGERRNHPVDEPMPTVTGANRGELAIVTPLIARTSHTGTTGRGKYVDPANEPAKTITSSNDAALVAPLLVRCAHGDGDGDTKRWGNGHLPATDPLPTVTASKDFAVVTPFLTEVGNTGGNGEYVRPVTKPNATQTTKAKDLLVAPILVQTGYGERAGQSPRTLNIKEPLGTVVSSQKHALVSAWLVKHFGGVIGVPIDTPSPTATTIATQNQVATAYLTQYHSAKRDESRCHDPRKPLNTLDTQNRFGLVCAFLLKYFSTGAIGQMVDVPLHTVTGKHRFGVVTVEIDGQTYAIADIGMRMLTPRELARAQGFPDSYVLTGTKTSQVARIGNSVCPVMAEVLVHANCAELAVAR